MRVDHGGEFWNYVIGGVVGAVAGGVVAALSGEDATGIIISTLAGAISGVVAASGLGILAQAGISAGVSGISSFLDQSLSEGVDNVNYADVVFSTILGGATSLLGSGAGKILGKGWADQADDLIKLGQAKLLTGVIRRSVGQSHSALLRQGYRYISQAAKLTNIFRGVSSVAGSVITSIVVGGYNAFKGLFGGKI